MDKNPIELSVILPCLNEADTLETCILKAKKTMEECHINGEIIVSDNGSKDGSIEIARKNGVQVVHTKKRGYGITLATGIKKAKGKYVVMGDADDSYDFTSIPLFLKKLRLGDDLVQGCRFPNGGGLIAPGAMPFLHQWLGNPMFSFLAQKMFRVKVHDIYCGLRGFTKSLFLDLNLRSVGMEFATEMIIKSSLMGAKISEVPITLYPDGRKSHAPHLKTFRDGWRTLRFFLMCSPRWLFLYPGIFLMGVGLLGYVVGLPRFELMGVEPDAHTLIFSSLFIISGVQSIHFAILSKTFGIRSGFLPNQAKWKLLLKKVSVERGLIFSSILMSVGLFMLMLAINKWWQADFGSLDYSSTMKIVVPGFMLVVVGFQTLLSSFFLGLFELLKP